MSAYSIYHAAFTTRYADDPQRPTKPALVEQPRGDSNNVWTGQRPAFWLSIAAIGQDRMKPDTPGPKHRLVERLSLSALAYLNTGDYVGVELALVDRVEAEIAYIMSEIPIGVETATIVNCRVERIAVGKNKTPAVKAVITWDATLDVTDADFPLTTGDIPDTFRPDFLELHQLPEDVVTTLSLT